MGLLKCSHPVARRDSVFSKDAAELRRLLTWNVCIWKRLKILPNNIALCERLNTSGCGHFGRDLIVTQN